MYMKTNYWFNRNRLLSHLRRSLCALAIIGAGLMLPSAEAGKPEPASGTFSPCFHITSVRQAGPDTIVTFSVTAMLTGTLTGSAIFTERDVIHPDGSVTFQGSGVFTDQSGCGSVLATYAGPGRNVDGSESADLVGSQGTGRYLGVPAEGTFHGKLVPSEVDCVVSGAGTLNLHL